MLFFHAARRCWYRKQCRRVVFWLPISIWTFHINAQPVVGGSIKGRIVDARTQAGVAAGSVTLSPSRRTAAADPQGHFLFSDIAPGTYRLRISAGGYHDANVLNVQVRPGGETAVLCEIHSLETEAVCDTCVRAALLIGRATDAAGNPLRDVHLSVTGTEITARSGYDGLYSLAGLDGGEYAVFVSHADFHPDTLHDVAVKAGVVVTRNLQLSPLVSAQEKTGTLRGLVRDSASGAAIAGVNVSFLGTEHAVQSDDLGRFAIELVEPGVYSLLLARWEYEAQVLSGIVFEAGDVIDTSIHLAPRARAGSEQTRRSGSLQGVVLDADNKPVINARVAVDGSEQFTSTDLQGRFTFEDVDGGVYAVTVSADGFEPRRSEDVDVWEGEATSVRVQMTREQSVVKGVVALAPGQGGLSGLVVDAASGEPLAGVTVTTGTEREPRRAVSDLQGRYAFDALFPGTYTLTASHAGYNRVESAPLIVTAQQMGTADFVMSSSDVTEMQTMNVRAVRVQNTGASLLRERQASFTVSDGISAAEISRAGAGNVAAAMKQIPGVTIQDGKYVVIRGLSERYILTTLNGMILPSPDPDKRAVPLDMFPTALIDNVVTYKSFTADLPASFSGGNVDIVTRAIPEKLTFAASVGGRIDKQVFEEDNTLYYTGGKLDWLGIDDGTRDIPLFLDTLSTTIPHVTQAVRIGRDDTAAAIIDQAAEAFDDDGFVPQRGRKSPDFSGNATLANRFVLGSHVLGALVSLTYSHSTTSYENSTNSRYKYAQMISQGEYDALDPVRLYVEDRTTKDVLWGGLAALTWEPNTHQSVNAIYMLVHSAEDDVRYSLSEYLHNLEAGRVAELYSLEYSERDLSMVQFRGSHDLPLNLNLVWRLAGATTQQDQPNQRTMMLHRYIEPDDNGSYDYKSHENILPVKNPERLFRVLNESSFQTMIDLSFYPFGHEAKRTFLKLGWTTLKREREYRVRRFFYEPVRSGGVTLNTAGGPEHYFDQQYLGIIDTTVRRGNEEYVYGLNLYEGDILSVNYDARRQVPAWYAMGNVSPIEWLDVSAGIRHEETSLSLGNFKGDTVSSVYNDWLPGLGFTFTVTPEVKIRAMYGKTLAQPTERELAPYGNFDPAENVAFVGNPELEQTIIHNFDLRGEWFQHHADLLAVSVFYKRLLHPIEKLVAGTNGTIQYQNFPDDATVLGVEVEGRFSFERLSPVLQGLSIGGNASLIRSRLTISDSEYRLRELYDKDASRTRELQGQSPWVINAYVVYDNSDVNGYSAAVNFHLLGPTIMAVTQGDAPDAYSVPYPVVSLSAGRKLRRGFSVEGSVTNLFGDRKKVANTFADKEFVNIDQFKERAYGLKIGYKF